MEIKINYSKNDLRYKYVIIFIIINNGGWVSVDLKSLLNKEQYEGATTVEGQVLILAGAGSGKTRVLTYRMAHMVEDLQIPPYSILAITFTNKAAKEMRDRVKSIIGDRADGMWISTFHSTCVRILRREIEHLGYKSNFTIYDSSDQKTLVIDCMKALDINDKDIAAKEIINKIGRAKDKMQSPESFKREFESNFRENKIADAYIRYQKKLKENNAMDFDDLILKAVELFKKSPDVLEFYQRKFKYIMVDEYQDTNGAQYELIKLLASKYKNLCVVGDDDQCLVENTKIRTEKGLANIQDISKGDKVRVAIGNGETMIKEVSNTSFKKVKANLIEIQTKSGKTIKGTSNHLIFSKVNIKEKLFYVYLIYKKGVGYRISETPLATNENREKESITTVNSNKKKADKVWIIKTFLDKEEMSFYEEYLSIEYKIPRCTFNIEEKEICIPKEELNNKYYEIDNINNIEKLMNEKNLYKDYPHYISSSLLKDKSIKDMIELTFFNGNKSRDGIYAHTIELKTSSDKLEEKSVNKDYFKEETEISTYEDAEEHVKNITKEAHNFEVTRKAQLTSDKESLLFMPLGSVKKGMEVAIFKENTIVLEEVQCVREKNYNGLVYDLNIEGARNYISEDIVVHNCIYAWRGADVSNILNFEKDYKDAKVIKLEENYRSKDNILQAANAVIKNNTNRKSKALRTIQEPGNKIKIYRSFDDRAEGDFVSKMICDIKSEEGKRNDDFAILYRTNAQSRIFEETLRRRGIAYKIVGGTRFYDRKEIKDLLSYLRVISNPQDDVNLKRIINVPKRSIGDATVSKVQEFANNFEMNLWDSFVVARTIPTLTPRNANMIEKFTELMDNFMTISESIPVSSLIETILEDTGYISELEKSGEIEDKSRIENLKELVSDAVDFEKTSENKSLEEYLEKISLVQDTDKLEDEDIHGEGSVVLMTIHSAKGLEFPVVFMVGMENGLFPSNSDLEREEQMEESRRLCYVAITRAKESLYMTSAEVRRVFGRTVSYSQSDFISEIRSDLKQFINERSITNKSQDSISRVNGKRSYSNPFSIRSDMNNSRVVSNAGVAESNETLNSKQKLQTSSSTLTLENAIMGKKVRHDKFGVGTIVTVIPSGKDKKLTIAFDKQGVKTLLLSFAKLELL